MFPHQQQQFLFAAAAATAAAAAARQMQEEQRQLHQMQQQGGAPFFGQRGPGHGFGGPGPGAPGFFPQQGAPLIGLPGPRFQPSPGPRFPPSPRFQGWGPFNGGQGRGQDITPPLPPMPAPKPASKNQPSQAEDSKRAAENQSKSEEASKAADTKPLEAPKETPEDIKKTAEATKKAVEALSKAFPQSSGAATKGGSIPQKAVEALSKPASIPQKAVEALSNSGSSPQKGSASQPKVATNAQASGLKLQPVPSTAKSPAQPEPAKIPKPVPSPARPTAQSEFPKIPKPVSAHHKIEPAQQKLDLPKPKINLKPKPEPTQAANIPLPDKNASSQKSAIQSSGGQGKVTRLDQPLPAKAPNNKGTKQSPLVAGGIKPQGAQQESAQALKGPGGSGSRGGSDLGQSSFGIQNDKQGSSRAAHLKPPMSNEGANHSTSQGGFKSNQDRNVSRSENRMDPQLEGKMNRNDGIDNRDAEPFQMRGRGGGQLINEGPETREQQVMGRGPFVQESFNRSSMNRGLPGQEFQGHFMNRGPQGLEPRDENFMMRELRGPEFRGDQFLERGPRGPESRGEQFMDRGPRVPGFRGDHPMDMGLRGPEFRGEQFIDRGPRGPEFRGEQFMDRGPRGPEFQRGQPMDIGPRGPEFRGEQFMDRGPRGPEFRGEQFMDSGPRGSEFQDYPFMDRGPRGPEFRGEQFLNREPRGPEFREQFMDRGPRGPGFPEDQFMARGPQGPEIQRDQFMGRGPRGPEFPEEQFREMGPRGQGREISQGRQGGELHLGGIQGREGQFGSASPGQEQFRDKGRFGLGQFRGNDPGFREEIFADARSFEKEGGAGENQRWNDQDQGPGREGMDYPEMQQNRDRQFPTKGMDDRRSGQLDQDRPFDAGRGGFPDGERGSGQKHDASGPSEQKNDLNDQSQEVTRKRKSRWNQSEDNKSDHGSNVGQADNDQAMVEGSTAPKAFSQSQDGIRPAPRDDERNQGTPKEKPTMSKSGDWNCQSCGNKNFQSRQCCHRCNVPRPAQAANLDKKVLDQGRAQEGHGKSPISKPGDWNCHICGKINFQHRLSCFQCKVPKTTNQGEQMEKQTYGKSPISKAGDWNCHICGKINFQRRHSCFQCNVPKTTNQGEQMEKQTSDKEHESQEGRGIKNDRANIGFTQERGRDSVDHGTEVRPGVGSDFPQGRSGGAPPFTQGSREMHMGQEGSERQNWDRRSGDRFPSHGSFEESRGMKEGGRGLPQHPGGEKGRTPTSNGAQTSDKKQMLSKLDAQERQFNDMFHRWENTFELWKLDNENNPNRDYVERHLSEMNKLRERFLQRRKNLLQKRVDLMAQEEPAAGQNQDQGRGQGRGQGQDQGSSSWKPQGQREAPYSQEPSSASSISQAYREFSEEGVASMISTGGPASKAGIPGLGDGEDPRREQKKPEEPQEPEKEEKAANLSAQDRANISRAISVLDDPEEPQTKPSAAASTSKSTPKSTSTPKPKWSRDTSSSYWGQKSKAANQNTRPSRDQKAPNEWDTGRDFEAKSEKKRRFESIQTVEEEEQEVQLFERRKPARDEDFWNPDHPVIDYGGDGATAPKQPKVFDYGHQGGSKGNEEEKGAQGFGGVEEDNNRQSEPGTSLFGSSREPFGSQWESRAPFESRSGGRDTDVGKIRWPNQDPSHADMDMGMANRGQGQDKWQDSTRDSFSQQQEGNVNAPQNISWPNQSLSKSDSFGLRSPDRHHDKIPEAPKIEWPHRTAKAGEDSNMRRDRFDSRSGLELEPIPKAPSIVWPHQSAAASEDRKARTDVDPGNSNPLRPEGREPVPAAPKIVWPNQSQSAQDSETLDRGLQRGQTSRFDSDSKDPYAEVDRRLKQRGRDMSRTDDVHGSDRRDDRYRDMSRTDDARGSDRRDDRNRDMSRTDDARDSDHRDDRNRDMSRVDDTRGSDRRDDRSRDDRDSFRRRRDEDAWRRDRGRDGDRETTSSARSDRERVRDDRPLSSATSSGGNVQPEGSVTNLGNFPLPVPVSNRKGDGLADPSPALVAPIAPVPAKLTKQPAAPAQPKPVPRPGPQGERVKIEDLLEPPGRYIRAPKIVVIFRGLPGAGKSYVAKCVKNRECDLGSDPPRILSLDDYFQCDGQYEYEPELEESYRRSLIKSFKRQIDDCYFNFVMVDCVNERTSHYEEMWSYAKQRGWQVFIAEVDCDPSLCSSRNIHKRSESEIQSLFRNWQSTPAHFDQLDLRGFLQDKEIVDVDMEDAVDAGPSGGGGGGSNDADAARAVDDEREEEEDDEVMRSSWRRFW